MSHDAQYGLSLSRLRTAFDRASCSYEGAAVLQARVADDLLERIDVLHLRPKVVVDLGAGTGRATALLKRRYPGAQVIALDLAPGMLREARRHQRLLRPFQRICADAHRLPFATGTVDVVFSSLMLQWCNLDRVFMEVRRVLRPEGFFGFSSLGPGTLQELRVAWAEADTDGEAHTHVHQFIDMHDVGDALVRAGLLEPVLDVDRLQLAYADTRALMHDLKAIGARNATAGRARSLTGKSRLRKLAAAYEAYRTAAGLPASFEVVYGAAWGAAGRQAVPAVQGEAHIDPGMIRRRTL
jgi:malonyl-CoA O-methyltransferase